MARIIFKIEGEKQTIRRLNSFDMKKKQAAQKIVRKHAGAVRKNAKSSVPVSPANRKKTRGAPGDLQKSIRAMYFFGGLGAMVLPAKPLGSHRHWAEYGTKQRRHKNGKSVGQVRAQPFMEPAKRSQEASYNAAMKKLYEGDDEEI